MMPEAVEKRLNSGEDYVIRFMTPPYETVVLNDLVRGEIKIDTNTLDDKVLFKSDGMPTFLAVLDTQTSEGSLLSIVETNKFKHLTHLSLRFTPGNDASINRKTHKHCKR